MVKCKIEYITQKNPFKASDEMHPVFMHQLVVDPYSGCSYGCQYCRCLKNEKIDYKDKTAKYYVGVKTDILFNLKKFIQTAPSLLNVLLGASTDPYQPLEENHMITKTLIETLLPLKWPLVIFTKSDLILRDMELLEEYNDNASLAVVVSFMSLEDDLCMEWEGNAVKPKKRLEIIEKLSIKNIACGAALMPIIPYINDGKKMLKDFFSKLKKSGSEFIIPGLLELDRKKNNAAVERALKLKSGGDTKLPFLLEDLYQEKSFPKDEYCSALAEDIAALSRKHKIRTTIPVEKNFGVSDLKIQYE